MTSTDIPTIRIDQPGELIEAIPYLIGFHPRESLVMIGFGARHVGPAGPSQVPTQIQMTLRMDLPDESVDVADLAPIIEALTRSGVSSVVAVIMTDPESADPRSSGVLHDLLDALSASVAHAGMELLDVLIADDVMWWSLLCGDSDCCPPQGRARSVGCSEAAAQATVAGLVALPDRSAVADVLTGHGADQRQSLDPALAAAEDRLTQALLNNGTRRLRRTDTAALMRAAKQRSRPRPGAPAPRPLTDKQLARFGVALADVRIRDELWMAIDEGHVDATAFLHELLTSLPSPYDAPALFLYGWERWRAGNGTLAAMAAERCLESDPRYSAASLLLTAVRSGLNPHTTPSLRTSPMRPSPVQGDSGRG
jgi:hypothetical protein